MRRWSRSRQERRFGRDMRMGSSDCRWLSSRLGYYLEGALGSRAMMRANNHLDECPSCQRSAALLEESLKAARGLRVTAPGYDFEEAVWEKIRISREIQRQPGWWGSLHASRAAWWGGGAVAFSGAAAATFYFLALSGPAPVSHQAAAPSASFPVGYVYPSDQITTSSTQIMVTEPAPAPARSEPAPGFVASAPQAGDETAPPLGPEETVASIHGTGRLEPGVASDQLYLEDIQLVPDPYSPDRSYVVRQAVVAQPGTARIQF